MKQASKNGFNMDNIQTIQLFGYGDLINMCTWTFQVLYIGSGKLLIIWIIFPHLTAFHWAEFSLLLSRKSYNHQQLLNKQICRNGKEIKQGSLMFS